MADLAMREARTLVDTMSQLRARVFSDALEFPKSNLPRLGQRYRVDENINLEQPISASPPCESESTYSD